MSAVDLSRLPDSELDELLNSVSEEGLVEVLEGLPAKVVNELIPSLSGGDDYIEYSVPRDPLEFAQSIDSSYVSRPHLDFLSSRLLQAVEDVENGKSRKIVISMPPRMGKSLMSSVYFPSWVLARHPDWKVGLISHSGTLAVSWGREVRSLIEEHGYQWGVSLRKDSGAASDWQTMEKGEVRSRSAPWQSLTGLGFKVMVLDDAVKDFASAHSSVQRQAIWDWWLANAFTRLEQPYLAVVVGTRWHEDDFIGRLLDPSTEGTVDDWEVIEFPALAETGDLLGREVGDPLVTPLYEETRGQAIERWDSIRTAVGNYTWNALYQQHPSPPEGAIFDTDWWRFWTDNRDLVEEGRTVYLDPDSLGSGDWLDSWDCTFKGADDSDFVVGQRWVRDGPNRFLVRQTRGRMGFIETLNTMRSWASADSGVNPFGRHVGRRLIESSANGPAVMETLEREISGIKGIVARGSKEERARAVTPEIESGHVYLPHPSMPGYEWVQDFISETRDFPNAVHDDQVDALSQALMGLRAAPGAAGISLPQGTLAHGLPRGLGASRVSGMQSMGRRY